MKLKVVLVSAVTLLLITACTQDAEVGKSSRDGIFATTIMTQFEYDNSVTSVMGIPAGAKVFRTKDRQPMGEPVMTASDVSLVDEPVEGNSMRVIKVRFSLKNIKGVEVGNMVAFFRPFSDRAYVVKTVLDGLFESIYNWEGIPGYSMASVVTKNLSTGEEVLQTENIQAVDNSQGLFRGVELHFSKGDVVYKSEFVRHFGTGLLVEEKKLSGEFQKDFHPYEFVLSGWPSGR